MKMRSWHIVQLSTDNSDVLSGTPWENLPPWARELRAWIQFSDADELHSLTVSDKRLSQGSGPLQSFADNLQRIEYNQAHYFLKLTGPGPHRVILDHNAVTAGTGVVALECSGEM